ncbi:larval cuticle protein A2B-like [Battus philenor]|uniref:larval cuticle protein A2B-like n=1 Tax=Battus philenor TaxID=42288 RepID=UPI0035D08B6A
MAAKFFAILALVAAVQGSVLPSEIVTQTDNDYSSFAYDVADPNTGDYKGHSETRSGGTVKGQYWLIEPDGSKRIVDYTADDVNGFRAVVRKVPVTVETKIATPVVVPTPEVAPAYVAPRTYTPSSYSFTTPSTVYTPYDFKAPYYFTRSPNPYRSYRNRYNRW